MTGGDNAWKFETLHQCAWMSLWGAELYGLLPDSRHFQNEMTCT